MDIFAPELDLVARLTDQLGVTVHVEAFPNDPEAFDFTQPGGAVLVRYNASEYSKPVPNLQQRVIQERTGHWYFAILHRNIREHGGVYALIEGVRVALTGYTLAGTTESTVLYPVRDRFVDRKPGKWVYEIVFAQSAPEVQS